MFVRGNSEVFLCCLSIFPKKVDRYLGNRESGNIKVYAPKFPPMTLVKVCPKFECNIYSDIDIQSAISVSSTGSFAILTDQFAFVSFSRPANKYDGKGQKGRRSQGQKPLGQCYLGGAVHNWAILAVAPTGILSVVALLTNKYDGQGQKGPRS